MTSIAGSVDCVNTKGKSNCPCVSAHLLYLKICWYSSVFPCNRMKPTRDWHKVANADNLTAWNLYMLLPCSSCCAAPKCVQADGTGWLLRVGGLQPAKVQSWCLAQSLAEGGERGRRGLDSVEAPGASHAVSLFPPSFSSRRTGEWAMCQILLSLHKVVCHDYYCVELRWEKLAYTDV